MANNDGDLAHRLRSFLVNPMELHLRNRVLLHCGLGTTNPLHHKLVASASPRAPVVRPPLTPDLTPGATSIRIVTLSGEAALAANSLFHAYANADTLNQGYAVLRLPAFQRLTKGLFAAHPPPGPSQDPVVLSQLAFNLANAAGRFSKHNFDPRLTVYEFHTALAYIAARVHPDSSPSAAVDALIPTLHALREGVQQTPSAVDPHLVSTLLPTLDEFHHALRIVFEVYTNEEAPYHDSTTKWADLATANASISLREFLRFGRDFNIVPRHLSIADVHHAYFASSRADPKAKLAKLAPVEPRLDFDGFQRCLVRCVLRALRLPKVAPPPVPSPFDAVSAQAMPSRAADVAACKVLWGNDPGTLPGFSPRLSPSRAAVFARANADPSTAFAAPILSPRVRLTPGAKERAGCATARLQHRLRAGLSPRQVAARVAYDPRGGLPALSHPAMDASIALWEHRAAATESARRTLVATAKRADKRRMRSRQLERSLVEAAALSR